MAKLLMKERSAAPSLCMSMKISPIRPSSYSPVRKIDLVAADHRLLGVALAAIRHLLALAHHDDALDQLLDDLFRDLRGTRRHRLVVERLDRIVLVVIVADELRVQRLRQLRAVAVERVGLQRELPGQQIGRLAILDRGVVRHVDGLARSRPR